MRVVIVLFCVSCVAVSASGRYDDPLSRQKAHNERTAIASLRKVIAAQSSYAAECGGGNYATSLMDLATPPPTRREGYLGWRRGELGWTLTAPVKGYFFTILPGAGTTAGLNDCNDFPTQTRYRVIALPVVQGVTGDLTFASNAEGAIWAKEGIPPPTEPLGPPAWLVR